MIQITMVIEGPESVPVSGQASSMLLALAAQDGVILRKFEINELSPDPGWRDRSAEIRVPEFMHGRKTAE